MNRRRLLSSAAALCLTGSAAAAAPIRTRWRIATSEGLDALAFLGPLSGKPFYTRFYEAELAIFRPKLPADALAALARLSDAYDADDTLMWPTLTLIMSGGRTGDVDMLVRSLEAAETDLLAPFRANANWDEKTWARFMAARPDLDTVLRALAAADFAGFRRGYVEPIAARRIAELSAFYGGLDVVAEQERLLGRRLDPEVQIDLLWFCKPHAARVQGQRFIAHFTYSDQAMVKTAAHELFHPPFDMRGATARACLAILEKDALFARILAEKDRSTGYNTLEGVLNEDVAQALDQIVQERLGFALDPKTRWTGADQGMHILAAGLYGQLKAEGYDRTGGNIERWMANAARSGKLSPAVLHAAAARVVERPVDRLWTTPGEV
ncbi:MAG: hypothetical protein ACK41C_05455 [Phenylobacterium sp.]|uniref:hypothetical protein n=1 Tax=Phenylobacterium sp. TaxID=1871053 RepID=UPI00391A1E17